MGLRPAFFPTVTPSPTQPSYDATMRHLICLLVFFCLPLAAQQPQRPILPQLKDYLQLSAGQLYEILANNEDYNRQVSERQIRIRQVMSELAVETAKPDIDPNALSVRYTEIEVNCRELKDAALATRKLNLAALDDKQKTKLKTLEDAILLLPVIADAQSGNLAGAWTSPPSGFPSISTATAFQLQFTGGQGPVAGCLGTGILSYQ